MRWVRGWPKATLCCFIKAMKTIVYVDGFNLYYGAVQKTSLKWLNIAKLSGLLLPRDRIVRIKYFTARIKARRSDPDQPNRQQTYLRALRTIPNLEIIYGSFLSNATALPLESSLPDNPKFVRVVRTEEKGSDVNIATHLVNDAHNGRFEAAILITNDSDLAEPVRIVCDELGFVVGILNPQKHPSRVLSKYASFVKPIRKWALMESQFSDHLKDSKGSFHKPHKW